MKTIEGKDYLVYYDQLGNVIDGEQIDPTTSVITNLEEVTGEKVEGYTMDELIELN
jgi:hypothetical protein